MNVIMVVGYNRPEFFYYTISTLKQCRGVGKYKIYFLFEHGVDKTYYKLIDEFRIGDYEVIERDRHYGLTRNILEGYKTLFQVADEYIIMVEDDVIISRDFLEYMEHAYRKWNTLVAGTGYVNGVDESAVYLTNWFIPYGVLIPKKFFYNHLLRHCTEKYYNNRQEYVDSYYSEDGFKGKYNEQAGLINRILHKERICQVIPEVPRSQEIGFYGSNKQNKIPDYDKLDLEEKIKFVSKLIKSIELIKRYLPKSSHYILKEDHKWIDLKIKGFRGDDKRLDYPMPRLMLSELFIFEKLLEERKPKLCLEWGSGGSTLYFPSKFKFIEKWVSIEHNKTWYNKIIDKITPNVELRLYENKDDYINAVFKDYKKFDFIFIDGIYRKECMIQARKHLKKDGFVLLHDTGRKEYKSWFNIFPKHRILTEGTPDSNGLTMFEI